MSGRRTPLFESHQSLKAKMVEFAGWEMPVHYQGLVKEHRAVRSAAGLFDVSHMGEFEIRGPRASEFVESVACNDASRLGIGDLQYSMLLNEHGGTIDDLMVYRVEARRFLVVGNAVNVDKVSEHLSDRASAFRGAEVRDRSGDYALLAFQGPKAGLVLAGLTRVDLNKLRFHRVARGEIAGRPALIAASGYSGENGFEIFVAPYDAATLWSTLLGAGEAHGVLPAGLGARDTLRLEASLPLYGHELDEQTSPLEAGLGIFVAKSGDYIGSDVMRAQRSAGFQKKLVMLEMRDRAIPRQDYEVQAATGQPIGHVTSGAFAPWLNKGIGMAYVSPRFSAIGQALRILIRGHPRSAVVVPRPFYRRPRR